MKNYNIMWLIKYKILENFVDLNSNYKFIYICSFFLKVMCNMYLKDITKNNFKKALNEVGKLERKQMHLHTHSSLFSC